MIESDCEVESGVNVFWQVYLTNDLIRTLVMLTWILKCHIVSDEDDKKNVNINCQSNLFDFLIYLCQGPLYTRREVLDLCLNENLFYLWM